MKFRRNVKNMKIAYVHRTPMPSEKANAFQTLEVAKALYNKGIDIEFFCPKAKKKWSYKKTKREIELYYGKKIPFRFRFSKAVTKHNLFSNIMRSIYLLQKIIKNSNEYNLFYTRQPYFLLALSLFKRPLIYEIHQWKFYNSKAREKFIKFLILKALNQKQCKTVVCISEELRKRWVKLGVQSNKTITAHDAVDFTGFSTLVDKSDARASLNLNENMKIVSYVGSLYKNRAIKDIIWAASQIPDIIFRIIGGPQNNKKALQKIITNKGIKNIVLTGRIHRTKIPIQLFASDVLLFTMNEDTFTYDICSPMKIFEYLAAGRAIVAPDLPSMREILSFDFCFLYQFPNKYSLKEKIIEAINFTNKDYNSEKQKAGRIVVNKKYTWEQRTKLIMTKYMENLEENKK
jgi:glycosyltransferase involved in cell wall biosynthesis